MSTLHDQIQEKIKPLKVVALFQGRSAHYENDLVVLVRCPPQTRTILVGADESYRLDFPALLVCIRIANESSNYRNWIRAFYLIGFDGELQEFTRLHSFSLPNGGSNGCYCLGDYPPSNIPNIGEFVLEIISYFWQSEFEFAGDWMSEILSEWEHSKQYPTCYTYRDVKTFLVNNFPEPIPEMLLKEFT